jgi:hypothetical protein
VSITENAPSSGSIPDPSRLPSLPFSERLDLPMGPGVYLCLGSDGGVLYVGTSQSLRKRWFTHHKHKEITAAGTDRIAWLMADEDGNRLRLEAELIAHFNPPLNYRPGPLSIEERCERDEGCTFRQFLFRWAKEQREVDDLAAYFGCHEKVIRQKAKEQGFTLRKVSVICPADHPKLRARRSQKDQSQ